MQWQVLHSKVRSSKPRLPGEIRANPILCLQVGHIGRSTIDGLCMTPATEGKDMRFLDLGLYGRRHQGQIFDPAVEPLEQLLLILRASPQNTLAFFGLLPPVS